ncbi:MGDG synthase family glycosyltransferase [Terrisporobacter vanillatitrophus]|uniref:MGDG synthase family glycosyltransferase n=1 Tax=Terrisporobacter vanillatitrophus TaxID=3058402 RepID=UPI003EB762B1
MKKLDLLLKNNDVDLVISTFPACSQYFSAYKKMRNYNIPLYTYVTDISVNEEWISEQTDLYFVGSDITKNSLLCKNVDSDKIVISGIPVKQNFKEEKIIEKSKDKKEVLIMGGGLGLIPCAMDFLEKLSKDDNIKITFIAGKNKKLLEYLKDKYPNVESIGYTDKVDQYMKKADLIISKSGGITLFEAIFSETPLYVIRPFLYQEIGNALYIQDSCIGKVIWTNGTDIYEDVASLLNNELLLKSMEENILIEKEKLQSTSPLNYYYGGIRACY